MDRNGWFSHSEHPSDLSSANPTTNGTNSGYGHRNSVQDAHQLLGAVPYASATPSTHVSRHLNTLAAGAPVPSYMQHYAYPQAQRYAYTNGMENAYPEYATAVSQLASHHGVSCDNGYWVDARDTAVAHLRDQAMRDLPQVMPPSWHSQANNDHHYMTNPFAQAVFQQTTPEQRPAPMRPSYSSLANALGPLPSALASNGINVPRTSEQSPAFFNSFVAHTSRPTNDAAHSNMTTPIRPAKSAPEIYQSSPDPLSMQTGGFSSPLTSVPDTPAVTPIKRKAVSLLEPTSVKKMHSKESIRSVSSSTTKYEASAASSSNTKVGSNFTFPGKKPMRVFVEVPPLPKNWATPTKSSMQKSSSPMKHFDDEDDDDLGGYGIEENDKKPIKKLNFNLPSSAVKSSGRRTGDRDERAPVEKFLAYVEDIFEAEDNVPADATDIQQLSGDFFSPFTMDFPRPLLHPNVIRKLIKTAVKVARPTKRTRQSHTSTPQRGGGLSDVDTTILTRLLKILERSVRAGEDIEPFGKLTRSGDKRTLPSPSKVKKSQTKGSKKNSGLEPPSSSPPDEGPETQDDDASPEPSNQDLEKLLSDLSISRDSVLAADCVLAILSSDRLPKQIYSEELITSCLNVIKNSLNSLVYPFISATPVQGEPQFASSLLRYVTRKDCPSQTRGPIEDVFQAVSSVLPRINTLVSTDLVAMSDAIVIQVVYIAIGPFFVDAGPEDAKGKNKEALVINTLGGSAIRGLRLEALSLIRSVFANHEDQRSWIIEEILTSLLQLSDTKQKAGQFRLRDGRSIRTVSALLLQLVQTSAHGVRLQARKILRDRQQYLANKSFGAHEQGNETFLDEFDKEETRLYSSGLDAANKAANTIILFLISRLGKGKTTKNSNEAEYRTIFDHLVADLLVVLFWPEWPAAGLLLSIAARYMVKSLDDVKSAGQNENNAVRTMALDHLGVIASRLRTCSLKSESNSAGSQTILLPLDDITTSLNKQELDRLVSARQEISSHLAKRASEDQAYDSARDLTGAMWGHELAQALLHCDGSLYDEVGDEGGSSKLRTSAPVWKLGTKLKAALSDVWKDAVTDVFDVGTQQDALRIDQLAERVGMMQSLRNTFQPILSVILSALDAPPVFMRTKALRSLGQILNADPNILSAQNVRRAIETHLLDGSSAVRDAAVELIGKYMVDSPAVADEYYQKLADRIADTGLGVRKRVIKLLKSYYHITSDSARQVDICSKLVLRMFDEDDTVRDLAVKTMEELWFPPITPGANSRTSLAPGDSELRAQLYSKVVVIMGVAAYFKDRQSPLEDLLHKIIADRSEADAAFLHARYSEICEVLIEGLADASDLPGFNVINCIKCIYLLTSAHPCIISVSHASTLLPYLKATNTAEDQMIADYLLRIFKASVPHMSKTAAKFGQDLQRTLQPMILKPTTSGGPASLQETVPCMCIVVQSLTHEYARLTGLLKSCNSRMIQYIQRSEEQVMGIQDIRALSILIYIVSLLGEHGRFDILREEQPTHRSEIDSISKGSIILHLYGGLLRLYNKFSDPALRSRLLQCLGFLFRAQPTLMTLESSATIMDAIFNSTEEEVRTRLLKIIQDFLLSQADKHSATEKSNEKVKVQSKDVNMEELVGNTDGFADSGVSSAVVQRYLGHILKAALSQHPLTQLSAVDILTFTIRQGLAHPIQSFPVIVALESSSNANLSSRAHALHTVLHSKHASLLNSRFIASARACFDYQKSISTGVVQGMRVQPTPMALLHRWYSLVRDKRNSRQEFLKALVKVFDVSVDLTSSQDDVDFTRFMAENFSAFDYKTHEEVLTVIKHLTSVLSTSGSQLVEALSPGNLLFQLRHGPQVSQQSSGSGHDVSMADATMPVQGELTSSDVTNLNPSPKPKAVERTGEGDSFALARTSVIVSMIMLLKAHLKFMYGLSEEKCSKFVVGKKSAVGDRPAARRNEQPLTWGVRLPFATDLMQTIDDREQQERQFLGIWNEDGATNEPVDEFE